MLSVIGWDTQFESHVRTTDQIIFKGKIGMM